jgi:ABC-2 type transport system ATP-binding protein
MKAIEVEDLRKTYRTAHGPVEALRGLSMHVNPGEIYGFIGVNGAGKSTTIKALLGLLRTTSGRATVFGREGGSLEARHQLGYLPEVATYHEFMTADELLQVHARLAQVPPGELRERCAEALAAVGLSERRTSRIAEFSKGMKQRFGIAQALVGKPPLLLLDEVTSGLDPFAQKELKDVLLGLRRRGITILFSSHQMSEVESICDRAGIVHRGRMRAEGTLAELLHNRDGLEVRFTLPDPAATWPGEVQLDGHRCVSLPRARGDELVDWVRQQQGSVLELRPARQRLEDMFHELILAVDRQVAM